MEAIKRLYKLWDAIKREKLIKIDDELEKTWEKISKKEITFFLCGNYNAGKTTLLNALLRKRIYPTGSLPTTKEIVEVPVTETIKIIDTPGLEDPEKDSENFEKLKTKSLSSDCIFVIRPSAGDVDNEHVYERLKEFTFSTVFVLLNKDQDYSEHEIQKFFNKIHSKIRTKIPHIKVLEMFAINLLSAERGGDEHKLKLWENSGIVPFINALYQHYNKVVNENILKMLGIISKKLKPEHNISPKSLALYAESRILLQIFQGANVFNNIHPSSRLIGEDLEFLVEDLKKMKYYAEIRPATEELYYQADKKIRPIIENVEFYFNEDYGPVAMVGLELRNCRIVRKGGDLFICRCRLENCELEVKDRADLWVSETSFEKYSPAIAISDRSKAIVVASNFDYWSKPIDADETSVQKFYNCNFELPKIQNVVKPKTSTPGYELRPYCFIRVFSTISRQSLKVFPGHLIFIHKNYWYLYTLPKCNIIDVIYWEHTGPIKQQGNNILCKDKNGLFHLTVEERIIRTKIPFENEIIDYTPINNWLSGIISDEKILYIVDREGRIKKKFQGINFNFAEKEVFITAPSKDVYEVFFYNDTINDLTKIIELDGSINWIEASNSCIIYESRKRHRATREYYFYHKNRNELIKLDWNIVSSNRGFHEDEVFGFQEGNVWKIFFLNKENTPSVSLEIPLPYSLIIPCGWRLFCATADTIGVYEIYTPGTIKKE